jgi:hypothetical protein
MRFPFRTERSPLSDSVPNKNTMKQYLAQFRTEAPYFLIFLKYVERVQFLEFESNGSVREIFAVHVPDLGEEMRKQRTLVDNFIRNQPKDDRGWLLKLPQSLRTEYIMSIATRQRGCVEGEELKVVETRWLVLGMFASGQMAQLALKGQEVSNSLSLYLNLSA